MPTTLCQADLTLTRGGGYADYADLVDELGDPYDLTGYDARLQVRAGDPSAAGGAIALDLTLGDGLALATPDGGLFPSRVTITITPEQTLALEATDDDTGAGNYWYDLVLTPPAGYPQYVPDDGPAKVVVFERVTQV